MEDSKESMVWGDPRGARRCPEMGQIWGPAGVPLKPMKYPELVKTMKYGVQPMESGYPDP